MFVEHMNNAPSPLEPEGWHVSSLTAHPGAQHAAPPGLMRNGAGLAMFYKHATPLGFENMTGLILEKHTFLGQQETRPCFRPGGTTAPQCGRFIANVPPGQRTRWRNSRSHQ